MPQDDQIVALRRMTVRGVYVCKKMLKFLTKSEKTIIFLFFYAVPLRPGTLLSAGYKRVKMGT
jgi:hypothetical protein